MHKVSKDLQHQDGLTPSQMLCTTENSVSNQRPSVSLSHHVGVGSAGHALTSVEVEEFVDL